MVTCKVIYEGISHYRNDRDKGGMMKSKQCNHYIKEVGCTACYGHEYDEKCKGHRGKCPMYEIKGE